MKLKGLFKKISAGIYSSIRRFPITLLFSTSVAVMLITISELNLIISSNTQETLQKIVMAIALGIPLSLCARVFYERKQDKNTTKLITYYIISAIIPILYYFFLLNDFNMVSTTRYFGVNLAFYLCFIYIPYILNKKNFEMYVINLFTSFLITYVYSAVLFAGLSAILFAIDSLLGIQIDSETYYYTFLVVALVFAPSYFLAYVPREIDENSNSSYSKILKILLLYIVMPLLTVYTIILYLYFGKIIITMEWPIGLVSHLVLWSSLLLTLVLFFISPIKNDNKWSSKFLSWAPKIILPILVMMFISMGIRINSYGVTENRYYVFVLGLWIFGTMIYLSLVKERKNIFILISLSIVVLLSVFGPVSSYSISRFSQSNRLESILTKNNMLQGDKISTAPSNISNEDKQSISSILYYFNNTHSLNNLDVLPENFKMEQMEELLGFTYENPSSIINDYFYYMRDINTNIIDISEYDYLLDTRNIYGNPSLESDILSVHVAPDSNLVTIKFEDNEIHELDLSNFALQLHTKYGFSQKDNVVLEDDLTLEEENEHFKFKFIIQNISGQRDDSGNIIINDIFFYLLVKEK